MKERTIKAKVVRNGIIVYSTEIPKIGVMTSFDKEGKEEKVTVVRNEDKYDPWIGMDMFSKVLVYLIILILIAIQFYSSVDIKHKIYNIVVIVTTIPCLMSTLRHIYYARKHKRVTKMKTALNKVLYEFETKNRILKEDGYYRNVKPYEANSGFIIGIKIGIMSLLCWSVVIPNICMVHTVMSFIYAVCMYAISIFIATSPIVDTYFNFLQRLISLKPDMEYYRMAKVALKNYEKVAIKIGHTQKELTEKLLESIKNCFEEGDSSQK